MSSKFNSSTMRNKTPPVCQKHEQGPPLPDGTIWPGLIATVIITHPVTAPAEIWTEQIPIALVAPGGFYHASYVDSRGVFWILTVVLGLTYTDVAVDLFLVGTGQDPGGQLLPARTTLMPFPIDTGQQQLSNIANADAITARVTA